MTVPRRLQRMRDILDARLAHVRCAIEHVHHRHNTSAILRTCDALGVHHVHLIGEETFHAVANTTRGAHRWLDLSEHRTVREGIDAIRAAGCRLFVADLAEEAVAPRAVPLDTPVCLWFGAELVGVDPLARAEADGVVTIPMRGMAQSLNVSVASALAMEAVAQRARDEVAHPHLSPETREATLAAWIAREQVDRAQAEALAQALTAASQDPSA